MERRRLELREDGKREWEVLADPDTGDSYYWNHITRTRRDDMPMSLDTFGLLQRLESLVIQGWRGVALYWRNKRLGTLAAGLHYEGALVLTHFRGWLSLVHRRRYLEERVATGLGLTTSAFLCLTGM